MSVGNVGLIKGYIFFPESLNGAEYFQLLDVYKLMFRVETAAEEEQQLNGHPGLGIHDLRTFCYEST